MKAKTPTLLAHKLLCSRLHALTLLVLGLCALRAQIASAQTWQTIDDFQYAPGLGATPSAITMDPSGNIWVAGSANEASPPAAAHALVQKSPDGGLTWSLSDDFSTGGPGIAIYYGAASDYLGNLYGVGYEAVSGVGPTWFARQGAPNPDGSVAWTTVDTLAPYYHAQAVTTDGSGNAYVAGYGQISTTTTNKNGGTTTTTTEAWVVRKGSSFGNAWSTVDFFSPNGSGSANGVFCHPTAGVFVTGSSASGSRGASVWTTRRSVDGGATWTIVDAAIGNGYGRGIGADRLGNIYVVGSGWLVRKSSNGGSSWTTVDNYGGIANGFAADSNGNLFVVGLHTLSNGTTAWVVRENVGGSSSWTTVDTFQYASSKAADAKGIVADDSGHIYVTGYANDTSGVYHWIVRKY